jgi:hypothetical protein
MFRIRRGVIASLMLVRMLGAAETADAQGAPTLSVTVTGSTADATWTAVAGATGYLGAIGTTPGGVELIRNFPLAGTSIRGALPSGTYYLRIAAIVGGTTGPVSNEVAFTVGNPAPLAPTGFTASTTGGMLTLSWNAPTSGGVPSDYVLQVGSSFGSANVAPALRLGQTATSWSYPLHALPDGTYFLRLYALNEQGVSAVSSETVFTKGAVPGVPVPLEPIVNGNNTVVLRWQPPTGGATVTHYAIEAQAGDSRDLRTVVSGIPADATSFVSPAIPQGGYYWRVRAYNGTTPGAVYGTAGFYVGPRPDPGTGPRTSNPAPGHRLSLPSYAAQVVDEVAAAYPADLYFSCVEAERYRGIPQGTNEFMFKVLRELRKYDSRWTLNWKRGVVGDLSQDIVNYNFGSLPDEGTTDVYILDVIAGHCGPRPSGTFIDQTDATARAGAIGRGTLVPYLNAGFQK